jgi:16S rRNA (guanine527-N7)-methyltransferase
MGCQRTDADVGQIPDLAGTLAAALGAPLGASAVARFAAYEALLIEYGGRFNLTAVLDPAGIRRRHFAESLAFGAVLAGLGLLQGDELVVDVGSGAGFPGVPLAIAWPGLRLTLVEATRKKAEFLQTVARTLELERVRIVALRAEEAGRLPRLRARFDLALARAVSRMSTLSELLLPLVRIGGSVAAVKGSRLESELAEAGEAMRRCGGGSATVLALPGAQQELRVVVVPKVAMTPPDYPRRPGLPAHEPIR